MKSFRIHGYQQWGLSLRLLPNWWGTVPQKLHYYPANALRSLWNDAIFWGKGPYWFQSGYVNKTGVVRGIGWALGQGSCIWIIVRDKCRCSDSWITLQAMKVSQPKWYNSSMQSITVLCIFCFWQQKMKGFQYKQKNSKSLPTCCDIGSTFLLS